MSLSTASKLYFGFGGKTMLITHRCFSYCWAVLYEDKYQFFSLSYCLGSEGVVGAQGAGRGRTRAADLKWPKGCFIPYGIMQKTVALWGAGQGADAAGHQLVSSEQLCCASLFFFFFWKYEYVYIIITIISPFLFCLSKWFLLYLLNSTVFFPFISPHSTGKRSECVAAAGLNHSTCYCPDWG